MLTKTNICSE